MARTLLEAYEARILDGEIEPDLSQARAARRLSSLADTVAAWSPKRHGFMSKLGWSASSEPPRGVYLHGPVGRGKTMLMDLFHEHVPLAAKRRDHFHEFMAEVHDGIAEARKASGGDPIPEVARAIARGAQLLCFDELHVTDIADAMILGRLFRALFAERVVLVATSNDDPDGLYAGGLNRQLFTPFIDLIKSRMDVIALDADRDYRLEKLAGRPLYFHPANADACRALDGLWTALTGGHPPSAVEIAVKRRKLHVAKASAGVARFSFRELCEEPLAAVDYLAIAHAFHTVIVDGVPVFDGANRDAARRFVNMIDAFYDNGTGFAASAPAAPDELCRDGVMAQHFRRTASRLVEMQSETYLARRHARLDAQQKKTA